MLRLPITTCITMKLCLLRQPKKGLWDRRSEFPQTAIKTALFLAKLTVNLPMAIKMALFLAEHTVVPQTAIYVSLSLAVNTIVGNLLWKQLLQNRRFHSQHSSELLVGGVVVEMHVAGGVDLLLGAELRECLD